MPIVKKILVLRVRLVSHAFRTWCGICLCAVISAVIARLDRAIW